MQILPFFLLHHLWFSFCPVSSACWAAMFQIKSLRVQTILFFHSVHMTEVNYLWMSK